MKRSSIGICAFPLVIVLFLLPAASLAQQEAAEGQKSSEGIVHTVVEGDTLWDLSAKYLGTPWKWTEIWERNRFLTNPHYIYPGIRIVILLPEAKEIALAREAAPVSAPAETAAVTPASPAPPPAAKPATPIAAAPRIPYLDIKPADFVRAGDFLKEKPEGIGRIQGGKEPKAGFVEGDTVYLNLVKEIPSGQMLGVYRVRGPIDGSGGRPVTGYVKYLIGVVQAGRKLDGQTTARVRQSFEDLTRNDLISEEIPGYAPVRIVPGDEGVEAYVLTGRLENEELSQGDFIYLDRGASAGVAVGNVFRVFIPTGGASGAAETKDAGAVQFEIARAVVVRVSGEFSTAYIASGRESFAAGVLARRGIPAN